MFNDIETQNMSSISENVEISFYLNMRLKNGIFDVPTAFSGERDEVLHDSRSAESLTEKVKL